MFLDGCFSGFVSRYRTDDRSFFCAGQSSWNAKIIDILGGCSTSQCSKINWKRVIRTRAKTTFENKESVIYSACLRRFVGKILFSMAQIGCLSSLKFRLQLGKEATKFILRLVKLLFVYIFSYFPFVFRHFSLLARAHYVMQSFLSLWQLHPSVARFCHTLSVFKT